LDRARALNDENWDKFIAATNTEAQLGILDFAAKIQKIAPKKGIEEARVATRPLHKAWREGIKFANKKYVKALQKQNRMNWRRTVWENQPKSKEGKRIYKIDRILNLDNEVRPQFQDDKDVAKALVMYSGTIGGKMLEKLYPPEVANRKYISSRGFSEVVLGMKKRGKKRFKKRRGFKKNGVRRFRFKKHRRSAFGRKRKHRRHRKGGRRIFRHRRRGGRRHRRRF